MKTNLLYRFLRDLQAPQPLFLKQLTLAILLTCSCLGLFSQNTCTKWHFGQSAGLNFMTSPPTAVNSSMNSLEGCSSMADASGNLLFYTNGVTVWDSQNTVMANGTGLLGSDNTIQSSLIVKQPGSSSSYFVFTLDAQGYSNGLRYSVVDMSLAAGMGSVTTKNAALYTPSMEMLSGVVHCNGTDVWVVSHQFNSNNFVSYLVTASGVNPTPVLSTAGAVLSGSGQGCIKFAPNGRKLGMTTLSGSSSRAELYDFDPATGIVSNQLDLLNGQGSYLYACEFSPDGTKFYTTLVLAPGILQWDLCAGSALAIKNSSLSVATPTAFIYGLQMAPDGKIYCAQNNKQALSVINSPNAAGLACNFVEGALSIGTATSQSALPNFICSYFKPVNTYSITSQLSCTTASFTSALSTSLGSCNLNSPAAGFLWNFGEPGSGAANTSTLSNPTHNYSTGGSYTVKLIQYFTCSSDTTTISLQIAPLPTITVGSFSICSGSQTTLTASGASSYSWSSGPTTSSIVVSPTVTTAYTVTGTSTLTSCSAVKTASVSVFICVGMESNVMKTQVELYPNPFREKLSLALADKAEVLIYSQLGNLVYEGILQKGENELDLSALDSGIFFARIISANGTDIVRLIKVE